jgi:RNA polymerase sigma factor (sigma-70 family)
MRESPLAAIVSRLVRGLPPADGTGDDALLARFVGWRDEAAFELIVYRHGPMVRAVCRRVLRHEHDAEDAFQATFLALARKAAGVRGKSLAGWLYRVAFHAALKAKARSARREFGLSEIAVAVRDDGHGRDLAAVLDEEIVRLPERYRLPVVLCYLQGRSNREAAAALGIPKGTVDSRLSTARQKLRVRLIRRGLAPAVAAAAVEGSVDAAEVPGAAARAVTKAAVAFLSKQVAPATTAAVLAEGVLHNMYLTKLTWTMAAAVALTVLGSGAGMATYGALKDEKAPEKTAIESKPVATELSPQENPLPPASRLGEHTYASICGFLQHPVNIEKAMEGPPLREVLEYLTDKYGVKFIVDTMAFERDGVCGGKNVLDTPVNLPRLPGVSLSTVLRFLLTQVNGAYLVRKDYIEVTTDSQKVFEAFGPAEGSHTSKLPPTVNVVVQGRRLEEAIADLANQTGENIVIDPQVQETKRPPITARFLNTPVDAAVRLIADMAGLESVKVGNVYYVTSRENADRLRNREQ